MKTIFPPEVIGNSLENHFFRNSHQSVIIYSTIVIAVFIALILLPVIKVDITQQNRGVIRTKTDNNQLITVVSGQIEWLGIKENMDVSKGDTLLILNSETLNRQIELNQYKITENGNYLYDLKCLLESKDSLITPKYEGVYLEHTQKINDYKTRIARARQEYLLAKDLYKNKVGNKVDYENKRYEYQLAQQALDIYSKQQQSNWEDLLSNYKLEVEEYKSNIVRLNKEKNLYVITAPVSGTISQFNGIQKGNFSVPNQVIANISPHDDLLVECYVPPSDIGYIKKDMKAVFQIDAFNYNQWGTGKGYITDITKDIVTINNQSFFKVQCKLETKELTLKNGYKGRLKKGMTLTSRFTITRRSLFQLLYDKTDDWLNPKVFTTETNKSLTTSN